MSDFAVFSQVSVSTMIRSCRADGAAQLVSRVAITPDRLPASTKESGRSGRDQRIAAWSDDDTEALNVLKTGGALGLLFLLLYALADYSVGRTATWAQYEHWILLGGTCLFLGLTWTQSFRSSWRLYAFAYCAFVMAMFAAISAVTREPEPRFIAMMLCPLATASFVSWGWRWQLAMNAVALAIYVVATVFIPLAPGIDPFRTLGLLAALAFAQATAIFLYRYRRHIRAQFEALDAAARFRETQIATMAHDIRSPVATLTGYAELLAEDDCGEAQRRQILDRIASTAWSMNLTVSNVLDLYQVEEDRRFHPVLTRVDAGRVITAAAQDCAAQARRHGLEVMITVPDIDEVALDRHHLDRIVRNLMAYAVARAERGPILLRAAIHDRRLKLEVVAHSAPLAPAELAAMLAGPDASGKGPDARALGMFIARTMAESSGGGVVATYDRAAGLVLRAELPISDLGGGPEMP